MSFSKKRVRFLSLVSAMLILYILSVVVGVFTIPSPTTFADQTVHHYLTISLFTPHQIDISHDDVLPIVPKIDAVLSQSFKS